VIGLMSALGPALRTSPQEVLFWLAVAFGANFGLQVATYLVLRAIGDDRRAAPVGIAAGNRNIALFLVALPPEVMGLLQIFIGCYQLPMHLTPILLKPLYRPLPTET